MGWALIIQEHNLDIRNQNVSDNVIADALSIVHSPEVYSWLFTNSVDLKIQLWGCYDFVRIVEELYKWRVISL